MLNAAGDGARAFRQLGLPGHPSIVIFDETGVEAYRGFGVIDEPDLIDAVVCVLNRDEG